MFTICFYLYAYGMVPVNVEYCYVIQTPDFKEQSVTHAIKSTSGNSRFFVISESNLYWNGQILDG